MKILLASVIALGSVTPVSASADDVDSRSGNAHSQTCWRSVYIEKNMYLAQRENPGYVTSWKKMCNRVSL